MQSVIKFFFIFTLCVSFLSCKKDKDTDPDKDMNPPTPTATYYLTGVLDGEPLLVESNNGTITEGGVCSGFDLKCGGAFVDVDLTTFDETTRAYTSIYIGQEGSEVLQQIYDAYEVGEKGLFDCSSNILEGGEIIYFDEDGAAWSSNGTQNNDAYFEVLERNGTWTGDIFTSSTTFVLKAKFSCIVYNDAGDSKEITDGELNSNFAFLY